MIAIYYTGRFATDPPNVMTVAEDLIAQSTANNTNLRYADYTHLTVDPVDDTFWHVSEYFAANRRDIVGQFQLAAPLPDDLGVLTIDEPVTGNTFDATEPIIITIRNFGSNDITNPEVQYTIDGGTPVVENYSGTITAGTSETYTFTQTADLSSNGTFVIEAKTNLAGDSNTGNDSATKTVTGVLSATDTPPLENSKLVVTTQPNNQFVISMKTAFDETLAIAIYNSLGQIVAYNNLDKEGDAYTYELDMSYAASGVYLVQMGDERSGTFQTAKIIVK